jgi:hypothetical protein
LAEGTLQKEYQKLKPGKLTKNISPVFLLSPLSVTGGA